MRTGIKSAILGIGFAALASQADAAIYIGNLDVVSASNIGSGTLGVVTVTDVAGGVTVDVTLNSGINLVNTGGPHTPFAYDLNTTPGTITFSSPTLFSAAGTSQATPYGTFNNGVNMNLANGAPGSHGPLDFTINGVTTANFNTDSLGYYFAADLLNTANGATGSVAANTFTAAVPEPSTWAMMILASVGSAFSPIDARTSWR